MRCAECNRPIKATSSAFIKRPGVAYGPVCSYRLFGWVKREKRERTVRRGAMRVKADAEQIALEGFAA